ncbi:hypothetical protein T05_8895, partial [Trichinella murrelli]
METDRDMRVSNANSSTSVIMYKIIQRNTWKECRNGLHHQHRARSYSCVSLGWLHGVTQYCSRNLCGFAYRRSYIVNIVDLRWFSDTSHKSGSACCHQCVCVHTAMNAFFGNYPLLNMWFPYKDSHSRRSSSQSTTTNSSFKF